MDRGRMLEDARNILVNIAGGPSLTLNEVQILMEELNRHISDQTRLLFGVAVISLGQKMSVTILSAVAGEVPAAPASLPSPSRRRCPWWKRAPAPPPASRARPFPPCRLRSLWHPSPNPSSPRASSNRCANPNQTNPRAGARTRAPARTWYLNANVSWRRSPNPNWSKQSSPPPPDLHPCPSSHPHPHPPSSSPKPPHSSPNTPPPPSRRAPPHRSNPSPSPRRPSRSKCNSSPSPAAAFEKRTHHRGRPGPLRPHLPPPECEGKVAVSASGALRIRAGALPS